MSSPKRQGRVALVGAGPGDPGLLTVRAAELLRRADVLLYDALAADAVVALAPERCERVYVGKRGGNHAMAQAEIEALAIAHARAGKLVVRLKGGDPFVFGRGGEEAQTLRAAGIAFDVVPGISSAIAAPAYAGIPVTHRAYAPAFTVATGHEDPTKPASTLDFAALAGANKTLVLLMAIGQLRAIAQRLIEHGLDPATPAAVIQDGTRATQRTVTASLASLADAVERAGVTAPAVTVIGDVVRLRDEIAWFDRWPLFGKRVLVTRPRAQAAVFADALAARGAEGVVAPTIRIGPPEDPRPAERAIDDLASFDWLTFTSQNGVDAFFDRLAALDADARYLGKIKLAAIGSATAARLRAYGLRADLVPDAFVGEALARALIERAGARARVLIFRAAEARDVLPEMLSDAGLRPSVVAAYRTYTVDDPQFSEKVRGCDTVTFTSASTVRGFAELLGGDDAAAAAVRGKSVACIGPIAADAAREHGLPVDVVADRYTVDGLLDALEAHAAAP